MEKMKKKMKMKIFETREKEAYKDAIKRADECIRKKATLNTDAPSMFGLGFILVCLSEYISGIVAAISYIYGVKEEKVFEDLYRCRKGCGRAEEQG